MWWVGLGPQSKVFEVHTYCHAIQGYQGVPGIFPDRSLIVALSPTVCVMLVFPSSKSGIHVIHSGILPIFHPHPEYHPDDLTFIRKPVILIQFCCGMMWVSCSSPQSLRLYTKYGWFPCEIRSEHSRTTYQAQH